MFETEQRKPQPRSFSYSHIKHWLFFTTRIFYIPLLNSLLTLLLYNMIELNYNKTCLVSNG